MEIQPADPGARRSALLLLMWAAAAGVLLIALADAYLPGIAERITNDPSVEPAKVRLLLVAVAGAICLPDVAIALYLWRLGGRIITARRFPPPGMPMIKDTQVLHGRDAELRGRVFQVVAVVLGGAAIVLVVLFWRLGVLLGT